MKIAGLDCGKVKWLSRFQILKIRTNNHNNEKD